MLNRKTSQPKLVFAFLKGVSGAGILLGVLGSPLVIATPKPSEIGFSLGRANDQPTELKKPGFKSFQNTIIAQNSSNSEADRLLQEGYRLYQQQTAESLRAALEKWEAARQLFQAAGDKRNEASMLFLIGIINLNLGERQKALDFLNQALPLLRAVGDKGSEANTLSVIGAVYDDLGEKQKALDFLNQALLLFRAVGDREREANTLHNIEQLRKKEPIIAQNSSNSEADRLAQEGLQLFQQGTSESLRAALAKFEAARQLCHAAGDKGKEAITLLMIGTINNNLGDKQKALDFLNQALHLFQAVGDKGKEAGTLLAIGIINLNLGERQKALDFLNQALPLFRAVGDRKGEATTLTGIGRVYYDLGDKQKALDFLNQALPLFRAVGDREGEANTLHNIEQLRKMELKK